MTDNTLPEALKRNYDNPQIIGDSGKMPTKDGQTKDYVAIVTDEGLEKLRENGNITTEQASVIRNNLQNLPDPDANKVFVVQFKRDHEGNLEPARAHVGSYTGPGPDADMFQKTYGHIKTTHTLNLETKNPIAEGHRDSIDVSSKDGRPLNSEVDGFIKKANKADLAHANDSSHNPEFDAMLAKGFSAKPLDNAPPALRH